MFDASIEFELFDNVLFSCIIGLLFFHLNDPLDDSYSFFSKLIYCFFVLTTFFLKSGITFLG
jgi:hypothetical protein